MNPKHEPGRDAAIHQGAKFSAPTGLRDPRWHYPPAVATAVEDTIARARGLKPQKIRVVISEETDLGEFCQRQARDGYRVKADARGIYLVQGV